jgi:hypothetical protein
MGTNGLLVDSWQEEGQQLWPDREVGGNDRGHQRPETWCLHWTLPCLACPLTSQDKKKAYQSLHSVSLWLDIKHF